MKEALLTIDLDSILYNYRHLKCYYKKNIIAVLKDNAYGVGLIEVAKTLKNEEGLIIATNKIEDIITLRENGYEKEILYLNVFEIEDLKIIKDYKVSVIIQSLEQLKIIKNTSIPFHLKVNTGMNRLGIYDYEINEVIKLLNQDPTFNLIGVMSHFANNDNNHECYEKFKKIVNQINKKKLIIHCFASNSLNENFENICTHIRVGIKLYGIGERSNFLHNALTLSSPILEIKKIKKDSLIGYDYTYKTEHDGFLYILPIGYGQGYGRFNKALAYCDNIYLKQAGHISMDYSTFFSVNLIDKNNTLELLGKKVPFEIISKINNIDSHEILVKLNVKKQYIKTSIK